MPFFSFLGSVISSNDQASSAKKATQVEKQMYDETVAREQPYVTAGNNALAALQYGMGLTPNTGTAPSGAPAYGSLSASFDPSKLAQTPGYQWTLQQGEQALQDSASATGGVGGGNMLKALQQYGQGLASTTYQQQFQDYLTQQAQQFGQLQTIAGSGQNAAAGLGALGSQTASSIASNITGAGNAQAAGVVGGTNALTGGINSLASTYLLANLGSSGAAATSAGASTAAATTPAAADYAYAAGFA